MKNDWKTKKLIEIADVSTGKWDANHSDKDGKYRFYTCAYNHLMCETKRFSGQSLILPGNGVNVGEVFYYDGEFDAYQRTYVVNNIKIFPKYLHYHMLVFWKEMGTKLQYGSATNFIKIGNFQNYDVAFPPLSEQKSIVAILDEAFIAIAKTKDNAEKNLKNAKELFESYSQGVFETKGDDWEEKPLREVCELKSGTTIPPSLERSDGDVLYTKIADMNLPENIVEINTSSRFVNSDEIKQRQIIPEGAIIFPKRGGAIATNKKRKIIKPTIVDLNTMAIIPGKKIEKDYFYHWFQLFDLNDISNGANIPQINNYSFDEINIPYPISIKEQTSIVSKLDVLLTETKKIETIYQQKIDNLEELKKSILQKAFNGELKLS